MPNTHAGADQHRAYVLESIPRRDILEFAPGEGNPRNSEGAFLDLADGRLLFIWSRFEGETAQDHAAASVYGVTSTDQGETWSEPRCLVHHSEDDAMNIMSLSLMRMQNGDIGLFYFLRRAMDDGRLWLRRSGDLGETWSEPTPCTTGKGYYVTNNDRVVRLDSGRLIVPAAYHRVVREPEGHERWDPRSTSYYFYSDDDGASWREGNPCSLDNPHCPSGLQEPGVIELAPNILYGWARTDMGFQYEMTSINGGLTWSDPRPSRFSSPNSPLSMKRDHRGQVVAIWNPIPNYIGRQEPAPGFWGAGRTPLVIAKQLADGSWSEPRVIEDAPDAGYCYTAIYADDQGLLLSYCAGQASQGDVVCLQRLKIVRIAQADIDSLG